MTENEKIAQIKWLMEKHPVISKDKDFIEPLKDAIQALEEIQQYRAIGTIEEFKVLKEKMQVIQIILEDMKYQIGASGEHMDKKLFEWIDKLKG